MILSHPFYKLINTLSRFFPLAKHWLYRFHGGIFLDYHKDLALKQPLRNSYMPKKLILPLQQHMGEPASPCVEVGQRVLKYQVIAKAEVPRSVPLHAPTSGRVISIAPQPLPHASGLAETAIVIEPDGLDEAWLNPLQQAASANPSPEANQDPIAQFKATILNAGVVGMGGAGFPSYAKLPNQRGKLKQLIINGAECEPFITCDDMLMQTQPDEILAGAVALSHVLDIPNIIFAIESNKPKAISAVKQALKHFPNDSIQVVAVATVYPMGGQKQLIQETLALEVPHNKHAIDLGIVMMNVATLRAIHHAVNLGLPSVSRFVTVSGHGLNEPFNIDTFIGTPFDELAQLAKPNTPLNFPIIMGGPMMGVKLVNNHVPVIKTTNCILVNPPQPVHQAMACIRCGECAEVCPINLLPQQLYWHAKAQEFDKVQDYNLFDCIECGCCAYVCPSHIPLVQYYRNAKAEIKEHEVQAALAEQAKQRHEARLARLAREKQEREAKLAAKKAAVKAQMSEVSSQEDLHQAEGDAPKLSAREKAMQAARARQAAQTKSSAQDSSTSPASSQTTNEAKRKAAMAAAKARAAAKKAQEDSSNA